MNRFHARAAALALGVLVTLAGAGAAVAKPILLPTVQKELATQRAIIDRHLAMGRLNPPAPPCPENGLLPAPFSNCGIPEAPATTLPFPGNMAYWGGPVQVHPKVYLVYWGWGQAGAFPGKSCQSETLTEGSLSATLGCDPEGAGRYMADFVHQMGGTPWAGVASQYFERDGAGNPVHVSNDPDVLAGIWVDDGNSGDLSKTNATNAPGATNTYTDLATEAQRAAQHFGVSGAALSDADFVIAQPPAFSDPNALSQGYCAFHDYTQPGLEGGIYNGLTSGIAYTNMPYVNAINSGGANDCGQYSVNGNPAGNLDAFSIALGHEIMETITDPGAEEILGGSGPGNQTYLGGWYDTVDANENGDKCAYVGTPLTSVVGLAAPSGSPQVLPVPGAIGDITGNAGGKFAVQSTWSNAAAAGTGYCGGVNDLPGPLAG